MAYMCGRMSKAQFCMICLDNRPEYKLYPANTYNLDKEFEHFTGISLRGVTNFAPQFCSECAQRIINFNKFRDKTLKVYRLLVGSFRKHEIITMPEVKSLCRAYKLKSRIAKKSFQLNHCDTHLIHEDKETQKETIRELLNDKKTVNIEVHCVDGKIKMACVRKNVKDILENDPLADVGVVNPENIDDPLRLHSGQVPTNKPWRSDIIDEIDTNIDADLNIEYGILKVNEDKSMNNVTNNIINDWISLNDSDGDNDLEPEFVNSKEVVKSEEVVDSEEDVDSEEVVNNEEIVDSEEVVAIEEVLDNEEVVNSEEVVTSEEVVNSEEVLTSEEVVNNEEFVNSEEIVYTEEFLDSEEDSEEVVSSEKVVSSEADIENVRVTTFGISEGKIRVLQEGALRAITTGRNGKSEPEFVNSVADTENVKVTPVATAQGKIGMVQQIVLKPITTFRKVNGPSKDELLKHYKVEELSHEEQLADFKKRKENIQFIYSPYKCNKCLRGFPTAATCNAHMERHTDQFGTLECPVCGMRLSVNLPRHVAACHRMRYSCRRCPFVTNRKLTAITHLRRHVPPPSEGATYTCPHCLQQIHTKTAYSLHLLSLHPKTVCMRCGSCFMSEANVKRHIACKHREDSAQSPDGHFCEECNIDFSSESAFMQHLQVSPGHGAARDINMDTQPGERKNVLNDISNEANTENVTTSAISKGKIRVKRTALSASQSVKTPAKVAYEYFTYNVTVLSQEQQLEEIQKRKEKSNFKNLEFKCMKCYQGFGYLNTYNAHMEKHSDKCGPVECPVCCFRFPNRARLGVHVSNSHRRRYDCKHCPFVTTRSTSAQNHASIHAGTTYTCPQCNQRMRSKSGYMLHLRVAHPTDAVCALCGYAFLNDAGLRLHVRLKHRNEDLQNLDGPLCEECDMRFASETAYKQHLEVAPKHATPGKTRNNPAKDRVRKSCSKYPGKIVCEQCGIQLRGYRSYRHHFRQEHPDEKPTQCPVPQTLCLCDQCGKSFKSMGLLRTHQLSHGPKQFQCDICHKTFYVKQALYAHMRLHSACPPAYACPVCGRQFSVKNNLKRHIWTHAAHKPFGCRQCDKTYADASALRWHVLYAHHKRPYPQKRRGGEPRLRATRPRHARDPVYPTGL